jgi:hypothetical protein
MMVFDDGVTQQLRRAATIFYSPIRGAALSSRLFISLSILALIVSTTVPSFAQRNRPILRPATRDYFAGKIVLISSDECPSSLHYPRMLARIADHDLIVAPGRAMSSSENLIEWAKSIDYAGVDGVIVSLDAISGGNTNDSRVLEIVRWIRAERRELPVYGFTANLSSRLIQSVLNPGGEPTLDFLLIAAGSDQGLSESREGLKNELGAQGLNNRVAFEPDADAAVMVLLSRMLNRRFGFSPRFLPVFSSGEGRNAAIRGSPLSERISAKIRAIDGRELAQAKDSARSVDALLFVHTPQTSDRNRAALIETIAQTVSKSVAVALADLSETRESKDAVIAELRRRKLLDKLVAYASSEPGSDSTEAINRALSHVSSFLNAVRFLRDDLARVRRFDRAHLDLLFSSYMRDWAYALTVRPQLDTFIREQLKADPDRLGANAERAEAFAFERIRTIAEELFNEQFKRSIHAIGLSTGERVQFEISMLQRLQVRLPLQKTSEAEIRQSIYVPQTSLPLLPESLNRARWFLETENVDDRIVERFVATDWGRFKTDVEDVEIGIKIARQQGSQESYTISSAKKRTVRRITITTPSAQGVFYALGKLEMLGAEGQLAQDFQVAESPAFVHRGIIESFNGSSWSHRDRLEMLRFLGRVRMNRYIYAPSSESSPGERFSGRGVERFKQLVKTAEENFVQLVYALRPEPSAGYSGDEAAAALIRKLDEMIALGVRGFAINFDDAPKTLQKDEDRAQFKTMAAAHAHLINRIHRHLKQSRNDFDLSVIPAPGANVQLSRDYLKELGAAIPQEIPIIQTGVEDAPANRRQIVLDNFPSGDSESWRLFLGAKRGGSPRPGDDAAGFIARPMIYPRASMLPIATAAEYAWNPRDYDPQRAIGRALNLLYDERARAGLRVWLRTFSDSNVFEPLLQKRPGETDIALIEQKLAELQDAIETIGVTLDQGLLRGELARFIARYVMEMSRYRKQ